MVSRLKISPVRKHSDNLSVPAPSMRLLVWTGQVVGDLARRSKPTQCDGLGSYQTLPRFRNSGNVEMSSSIVHVRMSESFDLRFGKSFWMISQTISTSMLK